MGNRGGVGTEADDLLNLEIEGQRHDLLAERAPAVIGFGPDQQQDVVARLVDASSQLGGRPGQFVHVPVDDRHDRASRPLVEQFVGIEGGDEFGVGVVEDGGHRRGSGVAGIDPPFERDDERRVGQLRVGMEFDEFGHEGITLSRQPLR